METLPVGICALCGNTSELHNSHFLPKALYRLLRAAKRRNPHPVRVSSHRRQQTAFQATSHLLCADCEKRFDRKGENWVMGHCYRGRGVFRLRDAVEKLPLIDSSDDFALYSASGVTGIDVDALAYFCASVFWRASVQDWSVDGEMYERISLGKRYGEEFRQYLLGNATFPENAVVNLVLSKLRFPALAFNFPDTVRMDDGWCHRLHIPGMTFMLTISQHLAESKSICLLHSPKHPIAISTAGDAHVQGEFLRALGKVPPRWGEYPLIEGFEGQQQQ